jgi:6-phosphogluconolactonase
MVTKSINELGLGWAVLTALVAGATASASEQDVWIGTSTPRDGLSKGIYHARLNTETGAMSAPQLAAEVSSPGFLAMHPSGKVLYSTGSIEGAASVVSYRIDGAGTLAKMNSQPIGDGGAAHLAADRTGKVLLSAQYGGGSTALFTLSDDGSIGPRKKLIKHQGGSGVVPERQDAPHAHWVGTSPDNRFAFVPDLGLDQVIIYSLDADHADLSPHGAGQLPAGGGPRHMKFHPNGRFIYVLNELALSVTVFGYDKAAGTMSALQTIPTVPEEEKVKERSVSASEIRIHPSGRFVYAANRGHDTITAFRVDKTSGQLTFVEREPVRGSWPRNFNVDPTGNWLLAAGRDSNTIAVFEIDDQTGELTYMRIMVTAPSPICVLFGSP